VTLAAAMPGAIISATATSAAGSTSEFSNALAVFGIAEIRGTEADDVIRLVRDAANPALLNLFINNPGPAPTTSLDYASAGQLLVSTLGGDDALILDYSQGEVIPSGGINYDGAGNTIGDALQILGLSASDTFNASASDVRHGAFLLSYANIEALRLSSGQFTIDSDLDGLGLAVDTGVNAILTATQHISSLTIGPSAVVRLSAGGAKVLVVNSLSIAQSAGAWTGTLDLSDNDLVIHADANTGAQILARTTSQIGSGRNSGAARWQGTGISSGAASIDATGSTGLGVLLNEKPDGLGGITALYTTFSGQSVGVNDILVKYTYTGDADIDGDIDADDYARIDAGFANHLSEYRDGNFDYVGGINADDFFLIDRAYSSQSTALAANPTSAGGISAIISAAPQSRPSKAGKCSSAPGGCSVDVVPGLMSRYDMPRPRQKAASHLRLLSWLYSPATRQ
jgi:hypothetical protein